MHPDNALEGYGAQRKGIAGTQVISRYKRQAPQVVEGTNRVRCDAGILQMAVWQLEQLRELDARSVQQLFDDMANKLDLKMRDLGKPYHPLFNPLVVSCACG